MFLTKLFALFWLIPLVVSGSCPQDQKQISVRVTAEFRLHSFIKTVDHETTITASRNFATSFKKSRRAMKSGNSASSFGDAVQSILDTVGLVINCTAEGDKTENFDTKRNFLQLVRVITYSVRVDEEMAKIQEKTTVDSIPVSSAGNYGDRGKYGATYIEKMFQNEKGGNIVDNTFAVSTCYNESSQQEINELTQLKVELQSLTYKFQQKLTDLIKQNNRTNMQLSDQKQQNNRTNMQLSDQKQQNNRTNMQLSDLIQQNKTTYMHLSDLIQQNKTTSMQLTGLTNNMYQQNTSLKQMNTTLKQMNTRQLTSLKIVKAHGGLRADKCKFTCVGTTGRDSTSWSGGAGSMYTTVNMASCGFVDVPVVTTSLEGTNSNMHMTGSAAPYRVTTVQFQIHLFGYVHTAYHSYTSKPSVSTATSYKWNVNWAAYGYKEC